MYEIHIFLEVAFISGDAVSGYHARFSGWVLIRVSRVVVSCYLANGMMRGEGLNF